MARLLDYILVIDVESTCWAGEPPPDQESEIIEAGLCLVSVATTEREERRSLLIRPEHSQVSPYCTALTTLTQADVDQGLSLREACQILQQEYQSGKRLWASYGDYDRRQFEHNCHARGVPYPFGPGHINVKSLFAIVYDLRREVGLDRALDLLSFRLEGTHHRGVDDAWNIARILGHLLKRARQTS